ASVSISGGLEGGGQGGAVRGDGHRGHVTVGKGGVGLLHHGLDVHVVAVQQVHGVLLFQGLEGNGGEQAGLAVDGVGPAGDGVVGDNLHDAPVHVKLAGFIPGDLGHVQLGGAILLALGLCAAVGVLGDGEVVDGVGVGGLAVPAEVVHVHGDGVPLHVKQGVAGAVVLVPLLVAQGQIALQVGLRAGLAVGQHGIVHIVGLVHGLEGGVVLHVRGAVSGEVDGAVGVVEGVQGLGVALAV